MAFKECHLLDFFNQQEINPMNANTKKKVVAKTIKVWLELELDAHESAENENPVIYMDESGNIDWREEGDESFWYETKIIFRFKFTDAVVENEIEAIVLDGIDNYLDRDIRSKWHMTELTIK